MRVFVVRLLVVAVLASACGDGGTDGATDGVAEEPPTTATVTVSTTPESTSPPVPTSLPDAVTFEPGGDRTLAVAEFLSYQWSTLELWRDGWVEIAAVATGPPVPDRDSDIGRLFSDQVHDAIDAAGATDMVGAYAAVTSAGLAGEVLAVLAAHPEAEDAIFGPGTLTMSASVTDDGREWTTRSIPVLALGQRVASASDGDRIGLLLAGGDTHEVRLAITPDLDHWSVASLVVPFAAGQGDYDVVAIPGGGWLVIAKDYETPARPTAWVVSDGAEVIDAVLPGDVDCCSFEATAAGLFAHEGNFGTPSSAWFSANGIDWEPRTVPNGQRITGAASVVDGLVVSVRDDDAATTTQWRGTPDGRDWTATELPAEIEWELSVIDQHHEGIAQFVAVPGWGERGYQPPVPAASFTVDHGGFRFDATIGATTDRTFTVTVTDLADGEVVFDESGPIAGLLPAWARTTGTDLELLDADGAVVVSIPLPPFEEAYQAALAEVEAAEAAAGDPVDQAFLDNSYLLYSLDGVAWSSMVIDREGTSTPWLASSINGNRALMANDDGTYRVLELVAR
ncbi:MAG: hypothetical protein R2707_18040 [Acidimicrobiales bacterium]